MLTFAQTRSKGILFSKTFKIRIENVISNIHKNWCEFLWYCCIHYIWQCFVCQVFVTSRSHFWKSKCNCCYGQKNEVYFILQVYPFDASKIQFLETRQIKVEASPMAQKQSTKEKYNKLLLSLNQENKNGFDSG